MMVSSRRGGDGVAGWLVGAVVAEHGPEHVQAAAGQRDHGGLGPLALGSFALVVGARDGAAADAGKRGQEQDPAQAAVVALGRCSRPVRLPESLGTGARPA